MCDFCKSYESMKNIEDNNFRYEYYVSIVSKFWRRDKGKNREGTYIKDNFKLNYCPECGKEIIYA